MADVLAKHYNVGITNPWYEIGRSEQETYTRRQLPWAGNNYSVSADGTVSGPNKSKVPDGIQQQWKRMASASRSIGNGENYENLEALYQQRLSKIGDELSGGSKDHVEVTVTTADGNEKQVERYVRPGAKERSAGTLTTANLSNTARQG